MNFRIFMVERREILRRGLITFDPSISNTTAATTTTDATDSEEASVVSKSIIYTAHQMIKSKEQNKPFKVSFAGSSATTGRGNYFDESFPSVLAGADSMKGTNACYSPHNIIKSSLIDNSMEISD